MNRGYTFAIMRIPSKPLILLFFPLLVFPAGAWLESFFLGSQPASTAIRLMTLPPAGIQLSSPLWDYRTLYSPVWTLTRKPGDVCEYSWTGTLQADPNVPGLKVFSGEKELPILTPGEWEQSSDVGYEYLPSREQLLLKNYFFSYDHTHSLVTHLDCSNPILEWESLAITPNASPLHLCLTFNEVWSSTAEIACDDWAVSSLPTSGVTEGTQTLHLRGTGTIKTLDKSQQKQLFVRNVKVKAQACITIRLPREAPIPVIRYRPLDPVEMLLSQPEPAGQPVQSSPWSQYDESLLFVRPMEIDGVVRTGVFLPTPSEWRVSYTLEQLSDVVFYPIVRDPSNPNGWGTADLEVLLESGSGGKTLWQGEVNPQLDEGHTSWKQGIRAALGCSPGERITLVFRSSSHPGSEGKSQPLLLGEPLLIPAARPPSQPKPDHPKSVVLISVDTLRADAVGCIGGGKTTPWMDQYFGEGGVVWTNTEAPSSWTLPSHASLMLSQNVSRHGVAMPYDSIPSSAVTLAEHFAFHQYETAAFVDREFLNYRFGFQQGFALFTQTGGHFRSSLPHCLEYLRYRDRSVPLFLFLHSYDTHEPFAPPEEYRKRFVREGLKPSTPALDTPELQFQELLGASLGPSKLTAEDAEFVHSLYLAEVAYVDDMLRDFFNRVSEEGLLDDPIVVLISDHGEGFYEHKSFLHAGNLYEELLWVPVMFRFPDTQSAKHRLEGRVSLTDVPPTLFDILGWEIPGDWQGISLLPQMADPTLPLPSRRLYSELAREDSKIFALMQGNHKFINTVKDQNEGGKTVQTRQVEAYDLAKDPGETANLASSALSQATQVLDQTGRELRGMYEMLHTEGKPENADLDPATIRSLQAIGYLAPPKDLPKVNDPSATSSSSRQPSP